MIELQIERLLWYKGCIEHLHDCIDTCKTLTFAPHLLDIRNSVKDKNHRKVCTAQYQLICSFFYKACSWIRDENLSQSRLSINMCVIDAALIDTLNTIRLPLIVWHCIFQNITLIHLINWQFDIWHVLINSVGLKMVDCISNSCNKKKICWRCNSLLGQIVFCKYTKSPRCRSIELDWVIQSHHFI